MPSPARTATIGTAFVAKSAPDGYTILLSHLGPTAISPALQKDLPYDSLKDFEPITQVVAGPTLLVVRNDLPVQDVKELIAYAKANPGKLSYGSVGVGEHDPPRRRAAQHAGRHRHAARALQGLDADPGRPDGRARGHRVLRHLRLDPAGEGGQVRAIAISTLKRSPNFPEIPAVSETVPGFELNSWYGMMAPAGTPKPIVTRLQQELAAR